MLAHCDVEQLCRDQITMDEGDVLPMRWGWFSGSTVLPPRGSGWRAWRACIVRWWQRKLWTHSLVGPAVRTTFGWVNAKVVQNRPVIWWAKLTFGAKHSMNDSNTLYIQYIYMDVHVYVSKKIVYTTKKRIWNQESKKKVKKKKIKKKKNRTNWQHHDLHDEVGRKCGEFGGENDCGKYVEVEGEAKDPGKYKGIVGTSSTTCWATALVALTTLLPVAAGSGPFITACIRASWLGWSNPSAEGVGSGYALSPRPSQTHRMSLPGIIWARRPVSTWRISMNRLSNISTYGWCNATCSAVPSHSIVPVDRLGSPCLST